jgi:DnaJ-class molecular chaperone
MLTSDERLGFRMVTCERCRGSGQGQSNGTRAGTDCATCDGYGALGVEIYESGEQRTVTRTELAQRKC